MTKDRLCRQGRAESPYCDECGDFDDLDHKLFECMRIRKLWKVIDEYTPLTIKESVSDTIIEATNDTTNLTYLTQCLHYSTISNVPPERIPGIIAKKLATHHNQIKNWNIYLE